MTTSVVPKPLEKSEKADVLTKLAIFLLFASVVGKASVFISIPLGLLFVCSSRGFLTPFYTALTKHGHALSRLSWVLLLSIIFGIAEFIYGVLAGNEALTALKILSFNFCPILIFLGIWAGARRPNFLRAYIRFFAWFGVVYAVVYFGIISHTSLSEVIERPGTGSAIILGLLCFEPDLKPFWLPLAVASAMTIANQMRADWLGLVIGLTFWGIVTKKLGRLVAIAGAFMVLLLVGFIADIRLPALPGRGGEISARETISRAISIGDPELAQETATTDTGSYNGTTQWRLNWWKAIREKVFEHPYTTIFGLGYGYPIKALVPGNLKKSDITSPHSIFYFALGYSGVIGVILFFSLQACLLHLLWQTFRATGQPYGLVAHVSLLINAMFGNLIEAPQAGVPIYIFVGICIGPLFRAQYLKERAPVSFVKSRVRFGRTREPLAESRLAPGGRGSF